VGIAGEDDLDAPDLLTDAAPAASSAGASPPKRVTNGAGQGRKILGPDASAAARDQLVKEIATLKSGEDLALWAHRQLPIKNTLKSDDALAVEAAYQAALERLARSEPPEEGSWSDAMASPLKKTVRRRNKAHLAFVAAQPCLVCRRTPCEAHHLKFAQPRALGRKVSDEFTVPLCHEHHRELHRCGNEAAWWTNLQIAPLEVAKNLWEVNQVLSAAPSASSSAAKAHTEMSP